MTSIAGTLALTAGLTGALAWSLLWLGVALLRVRVATARRATALTLAAAVAACLTLEWALINHDFSIKYVAENGGRDVPLYFTVTSLWSALDGSLLLWLLLLAACGFVLARGPAESAPDHRAWAMVITGLVAVFFFALSCLAANPFETNAVVPADGLGPNPLLREHPAMGVHPPLLYAGYVGMVVPFGYALSALVLRREDERWLVPARRWALAAWSLLTLGIVLGAWWSYAVLGWGGYWAWDPVENAALLPWLTATAALHVTIRRQRSVPVGWAVGLFSCTFVLVLVGTFLTRSGAVASVHGFTQSPLGPMLLGFVVLAVAVVGWLLFVGHRAGSSVMQTPPLRSRDAGLLYNAILLVAVAAIVLLGTLFPLMTELFSGSRSAVGADYYNRATVPLLLVAMFLMGAMQLLPARVGDKDRSGGRIAGPAAVGLAAVIIIGIWGGTGPVSLAAFGLAVFVLAGCVRSSLSARPSRFSPGLLAHGGIAIVAIGVAASSSGSAAELAQLRVGESVTVSGVSARLNGIDRQSGADRMTVSARLALEQGGRYLGEVSPVLRFYPNRDMTVGAPSIRSRPWGDIYTTVTSVDQDGSRATVRLAVNPFIPFIWVGGVIIAAAGALALFGGRRGVDRAERAAKGPAALSVDGAR
jgi:cytochrome c-type biogenesis protein CcmF